MAIARIECCLAECDECGLRFTGGHYYSAVAAEQAALDGGWCRDGTFLYCGACFELTEPCGAMCPHCCDDCYESCPAIGGRLRCETCGYFEGWESEPKREED